MLETSTTPTPATKDSPAISLSWRTLAFLLLAVIAAMIFIWQPWAKATAARTITVQGQATVEATPDKLEFQPIFSGIDVKTVTAVGNAAVSELKQLGVKDVDIKTTIYTSSTGKPMPLATTNIAVGEPNSTSYRYPNAATYTITATVSDKAIAQKVSDYLASTTATGQVTPSATFSKSAQTKLNLAARTQASDDASAKAKVTAQQLGARIGKVIKITDASSPWMFAADSSTNGSAPQAAKAVGGPTIQPGTNEVSYSLSVEFELK